MLQQRPLLFDLISARAGWLSQRQAVLGQNVANADTPGFRPHVLKPATFAGLLGQARGPAGALEPVLTSPAHMAPTRDAQGPPATHRGAADPVDSDDGEPGA